MTYVIFEKNLEGFYCEVPMRFFISSVLNSNNENDAQQINYQIINYYKP